MHFPGTRRPRTEGDCPSSRPVNDDTDFEELAARVRTQSGTQEGVGTDGETVRSFDALDPGTLSALCETAASEEIPRDDAVIVISRLNREHLLERTADLEDHADLESRVGTAIEADESMPDDTILLLGPGAVEGDEIVAPDRVACGILDAGR